MMRAEAMRSRLKSREVSTRQQVGDAASIVNTQASTAAARDIIEGL